MHTYGMGLWTTCNTKIVMFGLLFLFGNSCAGGNRCCGIISLHLDIWISNERQGWMGWEGVWNSVDGALSPEILILVGWVGRVYEIKRRVLPKTVSHGQHILQQRRWLSLSYLQHVSRFHLLWSVWLIRQCRQLTVECWWMLATNCCAVVFCWSFLVPRCVATYKANKS